MTMRNLEVAGRSPLDEQHERRQSAPVQTAQPALDSSYNSAWRVQTGLPVSFLVKVSHGIFNPENPELLEGGSRGPGARRFILIDRTIYPDYSKPLISYLNHHQVDYRILPIEATEPRKDLANLTHILEEMENFGLLRRAEPLIAIGGGVLLDLAGLAANLYRRGIPYVRVPTTLLAIVDASVGAKTGINHFGRRNRLGSYYPPAAAYLDKSFLRTLDRFEISSGLGEILKMAVVKDYELFCLLEEHGAQLLDSKFLDDGVADEVISRSVEGMIEELEPNLWEKNLKRLVDFGHSFSPMIEMRSLDDDDVPTLTHGQAVTLDVIFSTILSNKRGLLSDKDVRRVVETAAKLGLPTYHPLFAEPLFLLEALTDTTRHRNGNQNLPVPVTIGNSVFINDLTFEEIKVAAAEMEKNK